MIHGRALSAWQFAFMLAVLVSAATTSAASGFGDYPATPEFTSRTTHTEYVSMRDGVRLAVRVSRPAIGSAPAQERLPVIWQHALTVTEDPAQNAAGAAAGYRDLPGLTAYGYVVVQVARRGNGQSFGIRRGYNDRTEADDAYEITEWLAAQPWSNGKIGIYGCSNTGDAAMQAVTSVPPHLKAAFAGCFSWNKFDAFHRGGIYAQWGTGPQRTVEQDMAMAPVDGDESRDLLAAAAEHQKSGNLFELWKSMAFRDSWAPQTASRFWYEGSISSFADRLRASGVAVYIEGGWYDELRDQGLIALLNLPNSRILIGPWKHCQNPNFALLQEIHRFFDTYLKDMDTGMRDEPRIHYFTLGDAVGENAWHTSDVWPIAGLQRQRLFIRGGAQLASTAPKTVTRRAFSVNVKVACAGAGEGPFAQPCHVPGEGVSYTGDRLSRAVTYTGSPVMHLRVSAQRSNAHFFVYLEDVAPDGTVTQVTEGRLNTVMREIHTAPWHVPDTPWHRSWEVDAQPLKPNQPATLAIDMMPTSYVFQPMHRIQVTVTGADYRERNRDADMDGAVLVVLSEPTDASWLDLPSVPDIAHTRAIN